MSASLAILTIGIVPMHEVLPLLTEYIDENNISHHSLLGKLSREEVMAEYAPEAGEETILTLLNDNQLAHVSRRKVERDLQSVIEVLDNQDYDVILLMSTANISNMTARNTIFLEPLRILPPLVSSIVEGHRGRCYCSSRRAFGRSGAKMANFAEKTTIFAGKSHSRF